MATRLFQNLFGAQTEQEEVFLAHFLTDFHVGTVQRADGGRTVHHELHVAGTGRFFTCGGNLLGQVSARCNHFHAGNTVVGDKHHFQLVTNIRVVIDHFGDVVDQFDHPLGHVVTRCSLAAKYHHTVNPVGSITALDPRIQVNHVQRVEQLALVFVNTLDLNIKQRSRINLDAGFALNQGSQPLFVLQLDVTPGLTERLVIQIFFQTGQTGQVSHPLLAQHLIQQCTQPGVGRSHPASGGNTVGLVVELVRPELIEVVEQPFFKQLGMQCSHAVDRVAANNRQMRHADFTVIANNRQPTLAFDIAGPFHCHFAQEATVDFFNDL